jgi:hypothetical protein
VTPDDPAEPWPFSWAPPVRGLHQLEAEYLAAEDRLRIERAAAALEAVRPAMRTMPRAFTAVTAALRGFAAELGKIRETG